MRIGIMLALAVLPALGQEIKWPASFEKLAAKAKESVDVNLDGNMLQMAGRFLSPDKPGEAKARGVIAGLKGVFVKNFEFEKEGEYTQADVDGVRGQLKGPGWSKVVSVIEKRESTEIFVKQENGKPAGMVILVAEPKELTIVQINGSVDLAALSELGGKFGVPKIDLPEPAKVPAKD